MKRHNKRVLSYGMYMLALLIFGTNGLLVSRISLASSQIVLMRTLIGGVLLTALNGNPYYSAHYIAARRMG